jgi:hypothetical protein
MSVKIFNKIFPGWTGGNYIDIQSSVVPPAYLLDEFPGATLAYSVRKLRTAYPGFAIEVRRDSDNATADIGFVGVDLDAAALTTFLGSAKGYVTKWYNQATPTLANSDMVQTTALLQPLIIPTGGQNYIFWERVRTTKMSAGIAIGSLLAIGTDGSYSTFAMAIPTISIDTGILFQQDQAATRIGQFTRFNNDATSMSIAFGSTAIPAIDVGPAYSVNTRYVHTSIRPTTSVETFLNGVSNGATATSGAAYSATTMGAVYAGSRIISEDYDGYNGELILYPSDKSTDRVGIETNIRAYYGF